jgi:outer membrane protein assembly factor BamE
MIDHSPLPFSPCPPSLSHARLGRIVLVSAPHSRWPAVAASTVPAIAWPSVVTPYKIDVVQGNFVSREQVEALQPGMSRQQVRDILGTPLVTSLFHADRWEYVFTIKRPGEEIQTRKLTVFFQGDLLQRFEGDPMPSETEFVAPSGRAQRQGQGARAGGHRCPVGALPRPSEAAGTAAPAPQPHPTRYPPLEAPAR